MCGLDLTFAILQYIGIAPMQNARASSREARSMLARCDAFSSCLHSDERDHFILDEMVEKSNGVGTSSDAGDEKIGQAALSREDLFFELFANHRLKSAYHFRIGMWAQNR